MKLGDMGLILMGIMIGTCLSLVLYEEIVIPDRMRANNNAWADFMVSSWSTDAHPFGNSQLVYGQLTVDTLTANYTVGLEGKYTCVYLGEYEDGELPVFKSLDSWEAINWAIEN